MAPPPFRQVGGFSSLLPQKETTFYQRVYFKEMPNPIQPGIGAMFPIELTIMNLAVERNQVLVLRSAEFKAFQHSGIGVDDFEVVAPSRTTGTLGFSLLIGNQGLTNFNTNSAPVPQGAVLASLGNSGAAGTVGVSPGEGRIYPFSGSILPPVGQNFAAYASPNSEIKATVAIFREPNIDLRFFSVELSGWLVNESNAAALLRSLIV